MIQFESIFIRDFMSVGDIEYEFKPTMGLLLGVNKDSMGADDNGAGKSSIIEALTWCLYGETVRATIDKSLTKEHVVRKGCKRATVIVKMVSEGIPLTITRTRSKNKGMLGVEQGGNPHTGPAAQAVLDGALRINAVQFFNLVHLDGSYPKLFAPSSDRDRKDILADLVEVGIAEDMQEVVKQRLTPVNHALNKAKHDMGYYKLKRGIAQETKQAASTEAAEYKKKKDAITLEPLRTDAAFLKMQKEVFEEKEQNLPSIGASKRDEAELSIAKANIASCTVHLDLARENYLVDEIENTTGMLNSSRALTDNCRARVNEMETLQARGKCPTCGQDTAEVGSTDIESLTSQAEGHDREVASLDRTLEETKQKRATKLADLRNDLREQEQYKRTIRTRLNSLVKQGEAERKDIRNQLKEVTDRWVEANSKYATLLANLDKYKTLITEARKRGLIARTQFREADEAYEDLAKKYNNLLQQQADLEFWKKGFGPKGVPSLYIETVLPSISSRIQKYANILTGGDVLVTLKAYRETKSKTVQESIQISAVNSKGASVYGSNSTGERNRINLAVTLGLIEYFRDMGVFESDLLVCDEIFDGLDSTGVEQGLLALREAAIPTVLVVSHHDHLKPLFVDTTYVTKQDGVSSIGV